MKIKQQKTLTSRSIR